MVYIYIYPSGAEFQPPTILSLPLTLTLGGSIIKLVGGFNPCEKYYLVKFDHFPRDRGEHAKIC